MSVPPSLPLPQPHTLRLVPLGGLGEVGMNCFALEQADGLLLIDCGVTFPTSDLGIDVYHPRFDFVLEHHERVCGIVLTHGHEDHIGALPYLLRHLDVPVWGPPLALELVRQRLNEHAFDLDDTDLIATQPGKEFSVGGFTVEPIRVTHSIADATALAIHTAAGLVVHTGDFKLDPHPLDDEPTDEARFKALGRDGVRLLLSDSTNVDSPGQSASERDVARALHELVVSAPARVVVGLFASNVQRLRTLTEAALMTGRKVCLLGRSVNNHVRAAQIVGRLRLPSDLLVPAELAAALPREQLLVIASGTQAERTSALTRLSAGTHHLLHLEEGDRVLLSSRIIPGNDRPVFEMMAGFLRSGVDLRTWHTDQRIHASGHAYRAEQERMIGLTEPRAFVPIHGAMHHLVRHAGLAREQGIKDVLVVENGHVVEIAADTSLRHRGQVVSGRVAAAGGETIEDEILRERAQLGRTGIAVVTLVLDAHGNVAAPPQVVARGVTSEVDTATLKASALAVAQAVSEIKSRNRHQENTLVETAKLAARRAIEGTTGRRPLIMVALTRV